MTRFGLRKPTSLLIRSCRGAKRGGGGKHCVSSLSTVDQNEELSSDDHKSTSSTHHVHNPCSWVPHPRNGIYYPKGKESVMEDVPEGAASFNHTFWLRSVEGVDHEPLIPLDFHGPRE